MATKTPKIPFKAGDDFVLTLTVTNKVSAPALAAETAVIEAQSIYDNLLIADPPDAVAIAAAGEDGGGKGTTGGRGGNGFVLITALY